MPKDETTQTGQTPDTADSVIERMRRPKDDVLPVEDGQFIDVVRAEMFKLTTRELAAVIQKNPKHPHAAAYRRAVSRNAPDDELFIEKIDLEALLDNKEVIITSKEGETEVEGVKMRATYKEKALGNKIPEGTQAPPLADSPNQPGALQAIPRHKSAPFRSSGKLGGPESSPPRPVPNEGPGTPAQEPKKPFSQMGGR